MIKKIGPLLVILLLGYLQGQPDNQMIKIDHDKEIVFGQSGSFSGHFKVYGEAIKSGILACFNHINQHGGIQGKQLRLMSLDDHGDAQLTQKNIELLYKTHGITMFMGVMGTRGILSLLPMIRAQEIALFFPWGSDPALHDASLKGVINGPGLLEPQLEALATHIVDKLHRNKIAIFHADDDFSTDAAKQLVEILKKHNTTPLGIVSYDRYIMEIADPAEKLIDLTPRVVICISTSMPTVKLINYFFKKGYFGTQFFGVDSTFLVKDILHHKGAQFSFTAAVPNPRTDQMPIVAQYRTDFNQFFPQDDVSVLSLTYYIGATLITDALASLQGVITKEALIAKLEAMKNINIQGFPVNFNPTNRNLFGEKIWVI